MKLTEKNKKYIDGYSYKELLFGLRNSPIGSPWFEGETGEYWKNRMAELHAEPGGYERHIAASKAIGW